MGTYFTYGATRDDVIAEVAPEKTVSKNGQVFETLRKSLRGSTLYTLHRSTTPEGETKKWIGVYLLRRSNGNWGYKPLSEHSHPYYFDCPLTYLKEADEAPTELAAQWREKVRAHHAAKKARKALKPQRGEVWTLTEGCSIPEVRIVSAKPLLGSYGGVTYRVKRSQLGAKKTDAPTNLLS